ncbi:MAG: glycine zipper domain-containing protein [Caulobacterales bacterium]|uniref:glycine zipper domain-containing protein n=1 Tax=Glycocaulis sp. TaxID=1969725 RepID=UPI003FA05741
MSTSAARAAKQVKSAVKREADAESLAAELEELRREFRELVEQVGRVGKVGAHEASTAAKATVKQGKETGDHLVEEVVDQWHSVEDRVVQQTRDNPWQALGIAAAAGLLIGFLARR